MIVAVVLAVVLVVVVVAAVVGWRSLRGELDAERVQRATDVESLRADLALARASEASYRGLVSGAEDWIWATDEHGTLTFSNPAGAALLGHDDLVGRSLAELTHPDDRSDGWSGVVRRRHADGGWRTVDTRAVRAGAGWQGIDRDLSAPSGGVLGAAGVAVVRRPVVDGRREVVGYELIGDGSVLAAFAPDELKTLGGGLRVWVTWDGEALSAPAADVAVLQIAADAPIARARSLAAAGFTLALDGFDGPTPLLEHCGIVKVRVYGRGEDELRAWIADPAARGLELVATGVATAEEFTRCQVLGFSHFQGDFFARPRGDGEQVAVGSLRALAELTASEGSFEDLERIIGADVGLAVALLHHVNSAFFALPRQIGSVHEAITLLGARAVRRWATVVALSSVGEAPDQLIALALLRARMCELLGSGASKEESDRLFTVGLFSVADALLDAPMQEVLVSLPFSDEIAGALLRREGSLGRVLDTVLRYEQGHFPTGEGNELPETYLAALKWADEAGRLIV